MLIRDGAQVHVLPVERIDYVEAQDDYVCFKADGKQYPEGSDAGARSRRCSIRRGSCGSTGRTC